MLSFKTISIIFSDFLDSTPTFSNLKSEAHLVYLIRENIKTNRKLWDLEDSIRITGPHPEYIADAKQKIDKNNQIRNDLIQEIDTEITKQIQVVQLGLRAQYHSESPGMIIDRLAILYIKLSVIRDLLTVIKETGLMKEYREKEGIVLKQINFLGKFLDSYFDKLKHRKVFFEIQKPVKIYNDKRIKKYIKTLRQNRKNSLNIRT